MTAIGRMAGVKPDRADQVSGELLVPAWRNTKAQMLGTDTRRTLAVVDVTDKLPFWIAVQPMPDKLVGVPDFPIDRELTVPSLIA